MSPVNTVVTFHCWNFFLTLEINNIADSVDSVVTELDLLLYSSEVNLYLYSTFHNLATQCVSHKITIQSQYNPASAEYKHQNMFVQFYKESVQNIQISQYTKNTLRTWS